MRNRQTSPQGHEPRRGSILIVAVGMLAVLALMAVTFALVSRTELAGSRTLTDRQIAEFAAEQGLLAALEILAKDDPRFDDFDEAWFTPPIPPSVLNGKGSNRGGPNPYHKLVYNDGLRRACYDLNWHINEDPPGDDNGDGAPGIRGIDDDGDGKVDEDEDGRVAGDTGYSPNAADDDEDADQRTALGLTPVVDEDGFTPDTDGRPGLPDVDDDRDGQVDEDNNGYADTDGDGLVYEDPGIPTGPLPYKDTSYTRNFASATEVNDDSFTGDSLLNENQGGKSFQAVANRGGAQGYAFGLITGSSPLDGDSDGRVWEEGYGPLRLMGTGVAGLKHVDENLNGAADDSFSGGFDDLDEDGRSGGGSEGLWALWAGSPRGTASGTTVTSSFVTYAGGRLGCNRQDDDEDSDGRIRTTYGGTRLPETPNNQLEKSDACDADGLILDEGGKINLNAHGSLYDPAFFSAEGALDGAMKLDSFRVSLVRFFEAYGFDTQQSRGLARAIILFRYGNDLRPGRAYVDDDGDHDVPANYAESSGSANGTVSDSYRRPLARDNGLDDNGNWISAGDLHDTGLDFPPPGTANVNTDVGYHDGVPSYIALTPSARFWEPSNECASNVRSVIDEPRPGASVTNATVIEGVDDDREFDPVYPRGDDRPYKNIEQMIDALVWGATGGQTAGPWPANDAWVTVTPKNIQPIGQPLGVGYLTDADVGALYAEAARIFNIVREDISVNCADYEIGKVNINVDLWGEDGIDNDNNGRIDFRRDESNNNTATNTAPIAVVEDATYGIGVTTRGFRTVASPARPPYAEYDGTGPTALALWGGQTTAADRVTYPAEEDMRLKCGAEKVSALKRAFRRAFGVAAAGTSAMNACYVDTIALSGGRAPNPSYGLTDIVRGPEYNGTRSGYTRAYDLSGGSVINYVATDTTTPVLGRLLRDQMWANIVDFQDDNTNYVASSGGARIFGCYPVPTMLVCSYSNFMPSPLFDTDANLADYKTRVALGNVDIFGVEGLHLNEVLLAPEVAYSATSQGRTKPIDTNVDFDPSDITALGANARRVYPEDLPRPDEAKPVDDTYGWQKDSSSGNENWFELQQTEVEVSAEFAGAGPFPQDRVICVSGQWRVKGIPRGGYVVMVYGDSNDGILDVSFPENAGVTVLRPPLPPTTYPWEDPNHTKALFGSTRDEQIKYRRFAVSVPTQENGSSVGYTLTDEKAGDPDGPYGFVTRPDRYDNSTWTPGAFKFWAIRANADPTTGFLVRVRAKTKGQIIETMDGSANKIYKFVPSAARLERAHFKGLRFLCSYVELVNISKKPIPLLVRRPSNYAAAAGDQYLSPLLSAFKLVVRAPLSTNCFATNSPPAGFCLSDPRSPDLASAAPNYRGLWCNPKTNAREATVFIPAAHSQGTFPPRFGYYAVALSEAAYAGSFGVGTDSDYSSANAAGVDVAWGDISEEDYPVQFMEFPASYTSCEQIFALWNRDSGMLNNPVSVYGHPVLHEFWQRFNSWRTNPGPTHVLIAGGEVDLWAGNASPRGTAAVIPETVPLDYCAVEKTAPVVCNITPGNSIIAQFAPVNANDAQFVPGQNAAWLQINPDPITGNTFQSSENGSLWWRCSQRNLWGATDAGGRRRLANWNKNYMFLSDDGRVAPPPAPQTLRMYLYPGHTDDLSPLPAGDDPGVMDSVELRMALYNRTVPVVLDGPFPTVGWLSFVHSEFAPWRNMAPVLPEERLGESDVARLFGNGVTFDDNILTRLIGLSGGASINGIGGGVDPVSKLSFRPTPFTIQVARSGGRFVLRPGTPLNVGVTIPGDYRSTVYPRRSLTENVRAPDWREVATVWPHGRARAKININTASMPVLCSVFSSAAAADIARFRPYRDILDVCGFSGRIGTESWYPSRETPELRVRYVYGPTLSEWLRNTLGASEGAPPGCSFFTKNAYCTLHRIANDANGFPRYNDSIQSPGGRTPPLDYDDSGAGYMNDGLADDVGERMEWFSRYWNVIDIKSRFFTVYARGRVCSPTAPLAAARIKALVERRDVVNILNAYPLAGSGTGLSPTPGADGITDAVNVLWKRFVTEY